MPEITVNVAQTGPTSSQGTIRTHTVPIDRPESKGGADVGAMGGELLLASLGGCFMSNLLEAIRSREAKISDVSIDVVGTLEGQPARYTGIAMNIAANYDDVAQMQKLVTISERSCIVANSLIGAIDLSFNVL